MTTFGVTWEEPLFFLALLALPFLAWRAMSHSGRARVPIPSRGPVASLPSLKAALWWVPDLLRALALIALVTALARPQVEGEEVVAGEGVDIMLTFDMSSSMNAIDISERALDALREQEERPNNRFDSARTTLRRFIAHRNRVSRDRIGLVIFGDRAWLRYPLTHDHARLVRSLDDLVLDSGIPDRATGRCSNDCTVSGNGTAIGDALGRAFNQLRRSDASSRVIILITDGAQMGGTLDARAMARHIRDLPDDQQVRVYTFLVGGQDQVWLPETDRFGRQLVDARGRPAYNRPRQPFGTDPELLQEIASLTGGRFYDSYDEAKFREDIADLERTIFEANIERPRHDRFPLVILIGLLLLGTEWLLRFTVYRSVV